MSSRKIDDLLLTLSASGWTYGSRFVLYDYETESLWFRLDDTTGLTCIGGSFADEKLAEIASSKTTWNAWKSAHPTTKYILY